MFCKQCKNEISDNSVFCPFCGAANNKISIDNDTNSFAETININTVSDNKFVHKAKKKKGYIKTLIALFAVILLFIASFGIISLINYVKYTPYREMLSSLSSSFIYYQEYEEISCFRFGEYTEDLNFFEKILNIKKSCQVEIVPSFYFLFDEDEVEDNENLRDLICEEEDEEIYNEIPDICELIFENGDAELVYQNEIIFYINANENNEAVSVTYNETASENRKEFVNMFFDTELADKFTHMNSEYISYKTRTYEAESQLETILKTALLFYVDNEFKLSDFISERFNNPDIKIEAHRTDEDLYLITVSGNCLFTLHSYDRPYREKAAVVFGYDISEKECYVYRDRDGAFEWYYYSKIV